MREEENDLDLNEDTFMKKKIPEFKTEEALAAFWDNHDFLDYFEDTEPAEDVIFELQENH